MPIQLPAAVLASFPNLTSTSYSQTSPADPVYNCIAWAAGVTSDWWWPEQGYTWPAGVPRDTTLAAFQQAFATLGFSECPTGDPEPGSEKVAFYGLGGAVKHAARQLPSGEWTSKLGKWIDLTHELNGIEGPLYGQVIGYMRRTSSPGST